MLKAYLWELFAVAYAICSSRFIDLTGQVISTLLFFGSLTGSRPSLQSASTEIMEHIPASREMSAIHPVLDV